MFSKEEPCDVPTDSFWEIDSYKRVVKRSEDGLLLCNDLMKMIQERAEIELKYSNKLKVWSKKWVENIDKSTDYGTNKSVLINSMNEAECLANIHSEMKDSLLEVVNNVKKWRNETYTKTMVGVCKEVKQFEDDFKKAQKPWAKHMNKFLKYKKEYESNVKNEKILKNSLAQSTDEDKKLNERLEKCKKENENIIDKLEAIQKDLDSYKPIYIADMTEVFEKTQDFEEKRLIMFKNTLINMHKCLDISQNDKIPIIYIRWRKSIETSDAKKDLKWWSHIYGPDMSMNWPIIPSKYNVKLNPFMDEDDEAPENISTTQLPPKDETPSKKISYDPELNPFEEPMESADHSSNASSSAMVIAVYDYIAQEADELTLTKGDVFEKLSEKDDQGWCTGSKDGKIGLYPEKYAKPFEST
ncbi:hypothetical protein HELRODRAFT_156856 [Helobdella robusta]|uniref:SH3 domain-containing protein n=1 Tax=Helobdella robusta TaxID=6412 RepID=T1EM19_HELRO|nr:hypothetical protein HELRODRAFT_156856 [Helobdella robusta]ESO05806.1 hypothetical protein HELRODRAFT_156856 [Helobdella robusta]